MKQSTLHVALIMDGNGRWAALRALPRLAGHQAGAEALRTIVEAAPGCGIQTLTAYAFSSDNWKRPAAEVEGLMLLLAAHLDQETPRLFENGVRFSALGRRDRLPPHLQAAIANAEATTRAGSRLHLQLAIDYSARDAIVRALDHAGPSPLSSETFAASPGLAPPVDLLIRTGGEQRLSDFLLWECAYAEFVFTRCLWPDFDARQLRAAVTDFHRRDRRFGALSPSPNVAVTPSTYTGRWLD